MKQIQILLIALFLNTALFGQLDTALTTYVNAEIIVLNINSAKAKVTDFITKNKITLLEQQVNRSTLRYSFELSDAEFQLFSTELPSWGFVAANSVNTVNFYQKIEEKLIEQNFQLKEKAEYEKLLATMQQSDDRYYSYWEKVRDLDRRIFSLDKEIRKYRNDNGRFQVKLLVSEEKNPSNQSSFTWVNMPGVEYAYLKMENPLPELSATDYQGLFLKYMFTRGKSYALIGAFKNFDNNTVRDSSQYDEMFMFALGQDFYSRYMGRGSRKAFNLYSSFNLGTVLATNQKREVESMWYLSPFIGVELFKNKSIILDNRVGYFIPFKNNRNMRGLVYRLSFNFVF